MQSFYTAWKIIRDILGTFEVSHEILANAHVWDIPASLDNVGEAGWNISPTMLDFSNADRNVLMVAFYAMREMGCEVINVNLGDNGTYATLNRWASIYFTGEQNERLEGVVVIFICKPNKLFMALKQEANVAVW